MQVIKLNGLQAITADTLYRLTSMLVPKDSVPTIQDLKNSPILLTEFSAHFVEAPVNPETGEIEWPNDNRRAIPSGYFNQLEQLTTDLLMFEELKDLDIGQAIYGTYLEREKKGVTIVEHDPELDLSSLATEIASKVTFYGGNLIRVLRANGAASDFNPKSTMNVSDFGKLSETELFEANDAMDDPVDIDNPFENTVISFGELIKVRKNEYRLETSIFHEAFILKEQFQGWWNVYTNLPEDHNALREVIDMQRARAAEYLKEQKAGAKFKGKARKTA